MDCGERQARLGEWLTLPAQRTEAQAVGPVAPPLALPDSGDQDALLRVLERPDLPLHSNTVERDFRDWATKRKVSAGTVANWVGGAGTPS